MDIALIVLTGSLITFTVLSLVHNQYWIFRIFDFPRLQKFFLSLLTLGLIIIFFKGDATIKWILAAALMLNVGYLSVQIFPFTVFAKKQVLAAGSDLPEQSVSVMIANVFQDNTNVTGCLREIADNCPDIVLLLETNSRWDNATRELEKTYPHYLRIPLENTYGMLLYSKLQLKDPTVRYLVESDIPSIHTDVVLRSQQKVHFIALHPTPPVPNENPRSTERDKELLLAAEMVKKCKDPVIVIGDLNDVAWSYTTELFLKMSALLDPRRGRGFYNTFHAHNVFMRFPLDHAFISTDFKLKSMRRLKNFNSDHFPMFIHLQYETQADDQQEPLHPDKADLENAAEKKAAT
ncbi:MAG: endonuclease [Chitinophagaceae bacterium]|nr:MAG: endonuclease [Chitinophagaceae bacterium]